MSSQDFMTSRRKFMQRSALGAGGLLFSSMLLASCTDHDIPDPQNPDFPSLGDPSDDWNNDAKTVILAGIGMIPEVGGLISALISIVWPSSNSPWDQVRAQVEALIDQKLADDDYNRVTGNLEGLSNVITDYKTQVDLKVDIKTYWESAYTDFDLYQPNFQQTGDEVLLLPIFAQFANLYLALLRDAVVFGASWGMTDSEVQTYAGKCTAKISEFTTYTNTWYTSGRAPKLKITRNDDTLEPFRSTNAYDRYMTMLVLDYMDTWPYYDITKYPNGAVNPDNTPIHLFTREVYSDPYGNRNNVDRVPPPFAIPSPATQFPTQITVWSGSRIDAVQLTYPAGSGPNGVTTTPRMGDQKGGSTNADQTFNISPDLPIIRTLISYDYVVSGPDAPTAIDTLQFIFSNGNGNTLSKQMGGTQGQFRPVYIGYDYYALSSIYIDGVNETLQNSANCIVFGFMRWPLQ